MDKVPKRDMTAFYGVRRVLEVEKIFLYLSYHDGGILDVPTPRKLKGLRLFLEEKAIPHGYVITQRWEDFGIIETCSARKGHEREKLEAQILAIPAPLACLWLSD